MPRSAPRTPWLAARVRLALLFCALSAAVLAPQVTRACSTCACGDPTLMVMGSEQPYAHRLRSAMIVRSSGQNFGIGANQTRLREQRYELSTTYAPTRWLSLAVTAPLVHRRIHFANLAKDTTVALGDLELRARFFVWRDRGFSPRHLLSAVAGLELPTAARSADEGDVQRPVELQVGSGSFDPMVGLTYSYFSGQASLHAVSTLLMPTSGFEGARQGLSWRSTVALQYQAWSRLALRFGGDTRWDQAAREPEGAPDPNSGGFVGYVSGGLVLSPFEDLVMQATVSAPVVQNLRGQQGELWALSAGASYDY